MLKQAFLLLEVSPQLSGRAQAPGRGALWHAGSMLGVGARLRRVRLLHGAVHALWVSLLVPRSRRRYLQPRVMPLVPGRLHQTVGTWGGTSEAACFLIAKTGIR